jgi:hypothetical protein
MAGLAAIKALGHYVLAGGVGGLAGADVQFAVGKVFELHGNSPEVMVRPPCPAEDGYEWGPGGTPGGRDLRYSPGLPDPSSAILGA